MANGSQRLVNTTQVEDYANNLLLNTLANSTIQIYGNSGIIQSNTGNITFNNTNSINASVIANGSIGTNIAFTVNTSVVGAAAAPNESIQVNTSGVLTGTANVLVDVVGNNMYIEGNVQYANASPLYFGGGQSNTANANFLIFSNVSSNSLDIWWQ